MTYYKIFFVIKRLILESVTSYVSFKNFSKLSKSKANSSRYNVERYAFLLLNVPNPSVSFYFRTIAVHLVCSADIHYIRPEGPVVFVDNESIVKHTYLAQEILWSRWQSSQGEALPLHFGWVDLCDSPKRGELGRIISGSGGLRSRYPPNNVLKICFKL